MDDTQPEITTKELASEYPIYITVSQSEYKLRLFINLKLQEVLHVAVGGSGYPTPTGLHTIQDKQVDPTWNVPDLRAGPATSPASRSRRARRTR